MMQRRGLESLDGYENEWLKAKHHFTINSLGNPDHKAVGQLVVLNDDEVAPGAGFPMHRHRDMEIVTYVRTGVVEHEDSLGSIGRIGAGDVQAFSAGTGIRHSERNGGDTPLRLFQIWIRPRVPGVEPHWEQRHFAKDDRVDRLVPLASGYPEDAGAVGINADARVLGAVLSAGKSLSHAFSENQSGYLVVAEGRVSVGQLTLSAKDGLAIEQESSICITALDKAEIVLVVSA